MIETPKRPDQLPQTPVAWDAVLLQFSAQEAAKYLFDKLDPELQPSARIVQISSDGAQVKVSNRLPWQDDVPCDSSSFAGVWEAAKEFAVANQDPLLPWEKLEWGLQNTLQRRMDNATSGTDLIPFCSCPVIVENWFVHVILFLRRGKYQSYYHLTPRRIGPRSFSTSLLEAAVTKFIEVFNDTVIKRQPTQPTMWAPSTFPMIRDVNEVTRVAAKLLMATPAFAAGDELGIDGWYYACNEISSLRHEGQEGRGQIQ